MTKSSNSDTESIDPREYREFSVFLQSACGINLGENKQYLVSTRIRRILIEFGLANLGQLTAKIKEDSGRVLRQRVLDAMTTNETFWFRDGYPYDYFSNTLIAEFAKKNAGRAIRIWSAACSSGQEPYSLSVLAEESLKGPSGSRAPQVDILATDLSNEVLESAKSGVYDRISVVRGLSDKRLSEHFTSVGEDTWKVNANIQKRVRFRALNLQDSYRLLGKFDIIFCRNVLIYFSTELKTEILTKLHGSLNPGGYLFLGSSEGINGVNHLFEMINCKPGVVYRVK